MRNGSDEIVEEIKTHILRYRTLYEIMWKNVLEPERPQMT
jgi:hypothetical protein